mgnify:CR=1 FL=1
MSFIDNTKKFLDNEYVIAIAFVLVIVFAGTTAPKLSKNLSKIFDNILCKLLMLFLIGYLSQKNLKVAIISAVVVLILFLVLADKPVSSEFMTVVNGDLEYANDARDVDEDSTDPVGCFCRCTGLGDLNSLTNDEIADRANKAYEHAKHMHMMAEDAHKDGLIEKAIKLQEKSKKLLEESHTLRTHLEEHRQEREVEHRQEREVEHRAEIKPNKKFVTLHEESDSGISEQHHMILQNHEQEDNEKSMKEIAKEFRTHAQEADMINQHKTKMTQEMAEKNYNNLGSPMKGVSGYDASKSYGSAPL